MYKERPLIKIDPRSAPLQIFERLKEEMPKFHHKVVAVAGDCSVQGLGLSTSDRDLLMRDVSVAQSLSNSADAAAGSLKLARRAALGAYEILKNYS